MLMQDENIIYRPHKSNGSCYLEDLESFVYGGQSTRFWMMRKHINSVDYVVGGKKLELPFYCWQCITMCFKLRDVDLVIEDDKNLKIVLMFLILTLKTVDGQRGTASEHLNNQFKMQTG